MLYLKITRLDFTFCIQHLSQFIHNPTIAHYQATCSVIRYLIHNSGWGVISIGAQNWKFLVFHMQIGLLYWFYKTNLWLLLLFILLLDFLARIETTNCCRSSSKAEYMVLSSTSCVLLWLMFLMKGLYITCSNLLFSILILKTQSTLLSIWFFMRG